MKARVNSVWVNAVQIVGVLLVSCLVASGQSSLDFPMSLAVAPDGKHVLVLNAGKNPSISVMEVTGTASQPMRETSQVPLEDAWLGLTFAPGGKTVYAGGGHRGSVYELSFSADGELKRSREFKASDFIGDVTLSPDGRLIYAADLYKNVIVVINPQSGRVIDQFKTGRRPYRILFHPDGKSYFVSSWADAAVYQHSVANGEEMGRIRLGQHTTDMVLSDYRPPVDEGQPPIPWKYRLYVTAANTNNVFAVGIGENKTMQIVDTIQIAPAAFTPLGMTPSALALSADQKQLYVACSDADVIASVNVSDRRAVLEEYIPTGAYPTAVRIVQDQVISVNGLGGVRAVAEASMPAGKAEHVIYFVPTRTPEQAMHAMAGITPDYTMKFAPAYAAGRKKANDFDAREPANSPPAGFLWGNARAAGVAAKNYGISELGQISATRDWVQMFSADLKQFEVSNSMPGLIVMPATDEATVNSVRDTIQKSRFASSTEVVLGDLPKVETLLGLRALTRTDAGPSPLR
jgi:YVTN family beta-propeller protein